jgi:hypothetical protein
MQEARYQFSGHAQIADARVVRTTGDAKSSEQLASDTTKARFRKKGLTATVSLLRLATAEMQQMFHATTLHPFEGYGLGNLSRRIKGEGLPWLVNPSAELYLRN